MILFLDFGVLCEVRFNLLFLFDGNSVHKTPLGIATIIGDGYGVSLISVCDQGKFQ
jgi:hypothetical protein